MTRLISLKLNLSAVFFVAMVTGNFSSAIDLGDVKDMEDIKGYKLVENEKQTELQRFASWFHQDWRLMFSSFDEGAHMYLATLEDQQKAILKKEIQTFVARYGDGVSKEVRAEWLKLGAQAWPEDLNMNVLGEFANTL